MYEAAPIGLCYFDTDLRFLYVNAWLANINGLKVEDHVGRIVSDILPEVAGGVVPQLRGVIRTGNPVLGGRAHVETPAHPGVRRHYMHSYYPDKSDQGTVVGLNCVIQDVTEQTEAEEDLRAKTDQLTDSNEELTQALARIRTLEDILNICSYCKRIVDEDRRWQDLQSYITTRTGSRFSHGMCPDCAKFQFPGMFDDSARDVPNSQREIRIRESYRDSQ